VIYASFGRDVVGLTAHSIVKDPDGTLFDITPLESESCRKGMRFVAHVGDDSSFFEIKAKGHSFTCPPDLMRDPPPWSPDGGGVRNDQSSRTCDLTHACPCCRRCGVAWIRGVLAKARLLRCRRVEEVHASRTVISPGDIVLIDGLGSHSLAIEAMGAERSV
jgi:hypothetical protein